MNTSEQRTESKHEEEVDLISNMPEPILVLILSGLPSTEELIRTSILSRRWRYLWTSVPSLDLAYCRKQKPSQKLEKRKFKDFVYRVLLNSSVNLDSFCLSCSVYYSMSTVERWIHATVMRNVKQLDLSFCLKDKSEDMLMPHCLMTCASLEVLSLCLDGSRLILPSFSGFSALRVLKLKNLDLFEDDSVKYFLESCPLLEELMVDDCILGKLDLCISFQKLKKLRIFYWNNVGLCGCVKLSCPKLVFLELTGQVASKFIFERLYSLKEAVIDPQGDTLHRLFPEIFHVQSLTTDLYSLFECMYAARDPVLPNLKTLELATVCSAFAVEALIQILKCCPKLESLILTFRNLFSHDGMEHRKLDEAERRRILTPDVKWVEFFEFNGERPKLDIRWHESKSEWTYMIARWGKETR